MPSRVNSEIDQNAMEKWTSKTCVGVYNGHESNEYIYLVIVLKNDELIYQRSIVSNFL